MNRVLLAVCGSLVIAACGGGGSYNPPGSSPAISITLFPLGQTDVDAGQAVKFTATVENDSSNKGVTWSCSVTGLTDAACGTFTNSMSTSATYNSPSQVSANLSVTVTATSIADPGISSSATVLVFPPLGITTATLASATPNANYIATLQASGGVAPLTWRLDAGALPGGLSLNSSGAITGAPTAFGTFTFTVQVADSTTTAEGGPETAQAKLILTVVTKVVISTPLLAAGAVGVPYLVQMAATGGTPPYTWCVTTGALPTGLTLKSNSGEISGTPAAEGNFSFTVEVKDSSPTMQSQTETLTLAIDAPARLVVTTSALTNASPNTNYAATLQATGGVAPLTWSLQSGSLPTGLSLAPSGAITGDPTVPGSFPFTVQVTDSSTAQQGGTQTAQAQLTLTVVTLVAINTGSLPAGSEGIAYLAQTVASGGTPPYAWGLAAGSLPAGLAMQPSSGAISGSPASQGSFTFTVTATDSSPTAQSVSQVLNIVIGAPAPLAITTSALLDGTENTPYNAKAAATGGTAPFTWRIIAGGLPLGVSLNASTGAIAGTPTSTGTANFTIQVTDSSLPPQTQAQTLRITVDDPGEECASSGNNGVMNGSYAFSLSGFDDVGFLTVVGSFSADGNGNITAGEADTNGVLGAIQGNILTEASSYSVGPDNRGCATLATPFGTFQAHFALGSITSNTATAGRMIEWASPSSSAYIASGQVLRQSPASFALGLNGNYVFRAVGWDPSTQGGREVCVGVLAASGNTLSNLEEDCNDAWNIISSAAPSVAGTYSTLDANGRGTGIVTLGASNSNITFYVVSSSQLLVVNADPGPFGSGEWDQQSVPAGGAGFTQGSLNGNMVFFLNGLSLAGAASAVSVETASADGNSSLAITFHMDRGGNMQTSSTLTCTYEVASSGRVTLSSSDQSCGSNPPVLYLTGVNAGFILDAAPGVDTGSIEPQSAGLFNNASLQGTFTGGTGEVAIQSAQTEVEPVVFDGNGNIIGTSDISSISAQDERSPFAAATYTVNSDGTFSVSSSGGAVAGVIISNTKFVMFSPSTLLTPLPTLLLMQK